MRTLPMAVISLALAGAALGTSRLGAQEHRRIAPHRAEMGERGARRHAPRVERLMRMSETLGLTDDQVASLDEIRRENVATMQEVYAAGLAVRSELAAGLTTRGEVHEAMAERHEALEAVAQERRERVMNLLTEDQKARLQEMHAQRRGHGMRSGFARGLRGMRGFRGGRAGFRFGGMRGMRHGGFGARMWSHDFGDQGHPQADDDDSR
ncbi:MAG: Spy/CpxP family protein refolding chaperone [Gemmatimonadetes bacterium]|nr:Spy/CpxP family protein refolding chaperone [Gemmatimonadota bacterium]